MNIPPLCFGALTVLIALLAMAATAARDELHVRWAPQRLPYPQCLHPFDHPKGTSR